VAKPEFEFFSTEEVQWMPISGQVSGLYERILARDPDMRVATRMLRFSPGCDTTPNGVLTHDFWEEIYILEGAIFDLTLGQNFTAGMYACRPPGMGHGPWRSPEGCTTFEVRYYARSA
jgi:ChrR-like protein with cupin domain